MKRREFICGLSCFTAGCFLSAFLQNDKLKNFVSSVESHPLEGFTAALSYGCNLNCKGCDTYSPLAKVEFLSLEDFTRDMTKLKEISNGRKMFLRYMGGEPLINPEFLQIVRKGREIFPDNWQDILTNGILLNSMNDEFWKTLAECNINELGITRYPIDIDRSIYENKAKEYGIPIKYYTNIVKPNRLYNLQTHEYKEIEGGEEFPWSKNVIDPKGGSDYFKKKLTCPCRNVRVYAGGKLYDCYMHAYIKSFIEYFKQNIPITKADYIKIADVKSIEEIDRFLDKPKPLCKYCKFCHTTCYGGKSEKWGFSERKISEWTEIQA